ncbi:DUF2188 domain-containing protein [Paraburkholderia sp. RL17-380-BIE-A]|jgi:pyridoxine/pyridoxamine 5'-phosphate oxidase|uniref:DUF2188 domain-containing protein n=1 Tax=Paraburkholderia sp. RL17-380-BIE-A TaxID=3031630 RepID=UPI0038B93430
MATKKDSNNLFIERRDDKKFAVRKAGSERASAVTQTQAEAIARAKELNPEAAIHVERVRTTTVGKPDKWRKG